MTSLVSILACMLAALLPLTTGYGTGPPVSTTPGLCDTMHPHHDVPVQNAGYPFEIVTSGTCYKPGMQIPVIVRVNKSEMAPYAQPYFEGLFVMAREPSGQGLLTTDNVGTFEIPYPNNITTYSCYNKQNSAVGHNKSTHWPCRHFKWTAPTGFTKNITFQGTIARNKAMYWMDVRSVTLMFNDNCVVPDPMMTCEMGMWDDSEKQDGTSGSDVIRAVLSTSILLALVSLIM